MDRVDVRSAGDGEGVFPPELAAIPSAWGGPGDVEGWALPRLQRLQLANTGAWGARVVRCLAMPSLVELQLCAATRLVDDGGELRARCPARRRVALSSCAVSVGALMALRRSGVGGLTLLDCSVHPRASDPSLAGLRGFTAFGCWHDPSGKELQG
ncbi:hypothetical protein I4F81_008266 [Pyropia yezoensis]|uniref:Uncharacterized protein n=1 Tax=Pyropia yezoensis TaxID=2788 RepID=A0ACC3C617_PYRYE|nr:hypothetical protein I4F81_008266 [Neopyropia yezoensis]